MDKIKEQLYAAKEQMQAITAPEDMKARLRAALDKAPVKQMKPRAVWKYAAASVLLVAVIFSSNYNAFAYYSKKLLGFDPLLNSTLQSLNEQGLGQMIDKQIELQDGTQLIIEGIMSDANQTILYYTLRNENGLEENAGNHFRPSSLKGFFTSAHLISGTSIISDDFTEEKGMFSFESVNPFAKTLVLSFLQSGASMPTVETEVELPYNPNKAMRTELQQAIKQDIIVDRGSITFQSIKATPTVTVIEGKLNVKNFDRVPSALAGIQLMANGVSLSSIGSGVSSSLTGSKFELRYDALPPQLESLEIVVDQFIGYESIETKLALAESSPDEPVLLMDNKQLMINDINQTPQRLEITITTESDVVLDDVSIETVNGTVELKTTIGQQEKKLEDGTLLKQRTLVFETEQRAQYLLIEGMHYMKTYNKSIQLDVK